MTVRLPTAAFEVLRAARRHRALLAAGLAAAAVATALPALAPSPPASVRVLTAARELLPGVPLVASDLRWVTLPPPAVPSGALPDEAGALGRLLTGRVRRGEPLTDVRLVGAGLVARASGLVASPVRLADSAEAALLHAGDRVDVLATPALPSLSTLPTTSTAPTGPGPPALPVAVGVRVLAVPVGGADGDTGALVVLAATPEVAARLAGAAASSRLSITLLGS